MEKKSTTFNLLKELHDIGSVWLFFKTDAEKLFLKKYALDLISTNEN